METTAKINEIDSTILNFNSSWNAQILLNMQRIVPKKVNASLEKKKWDWSQIQISIQHSTTQNVDLQNDF